MIPLRRQILTKAFKLLDLLIMTCSFGVAFWVSSSRIEQLSFRQFLSIPIRIPHLAFFLSLLIIWSIIFSLVGLHHSMRLSSRWTEAWNAVKAVSLATAALLIEALFLRITIIDPAFLGIFWVAALLIILSSRFALRYMLRRIRIKGRNLRHILIIGTNPRAVRFARSIEARPEHGYRISGFVDEPWPAIGDFKKMGYDLVADFREFPEYLRNHVVDEVVIALPVSSCYRRAAEIVNRCTEQGITVRHLSDIFNQKPAWAQTVQIEGDPEVSYHTGAMGGWRAVIKRMLDISLSSIILVFLSPLFIVSAFTIKIFSPGPIFFIQERVGLNKRRFSLYKFRTMVTDAEDKQDELERMNEASGPVFKIRNDPRITRVGKLLRKTSLDELPQLVNVLKGDMSLVGPRPLPLRDCKRFGEDWHRRRFSVRPGITCLWQVSGRNLIPFETWMALDMDYIDHWSLWMDLKILLKTIPIVLRGTGAA